MSFQKAFRKMYNLYGGATLNVDDFAVKIKYENGSEKWFKQDGTLLNDDSGYDTGGININDVTLSNTHLTTFQDNIKKIGKILKNNNDTFGNCINNLKNILNNSNLLKGEDKFIDMKNYLEKLAEDVTAMTTNQTKLNDTTNPPNVRNIIPKIIPIIEDRYRLNNNNKHILLGIIKRRITPTLSEVKPVVDEYLQSMNTNKNKIDDLLKTIKDHLMQIETNQQNLNIDGLSLNLSKIQNCSDKLNKLKRRFYTSLDFLEKNKLLKDKKNDINNIKIKSECATKPKRRP